MLDPEFRRVVQNNVQTFVNILGESSKDQSYLKRVWKFENEHDFRYGQTVGFLIGSSMMLLKMTYGRPVNAEEKAEIKELDESFAKEIREQLSKS